MNISSKEIKNIYFCSGLLKAVFQWPLEINHLEGCPRTAKKKIKKIKEAGNEAWQ